MELLADDIPSTILGNDIPALTSVSHGGSREFTTWQVCHFGVDSDSELLEGAIWSTRERQGRETALDDGIGIDNRFLTCDLDHLCGLIAAEPSFENTPSFDDTKFSGDPLRLDFRAYVDDRQIGCMFEGQITVL